MSRSILKVLVLTSSLAWTLSTFCDDASTDAGDQRSWLAGDHHVHSRYSVGWDYTQSPRAPIIGGDAIYPIAMNGLMGRHHGLSWIVTTDHGGPEHARINRDLAYPELLRSREVLPDLVQFYGVELNTPAGDHSSVILPYTQDEADVLFELETKFDKGKTYDIDPERDTEERMVEALIAMSQLPVVPVVIANHPSRSARGKGVYGAFEPAEFRRWNDAAPGVAVGMAGAPGHQAGGLTSGPGLVRITKAKGTPGGAAVKGTKATKATKSTKGVSPDWTAKKSGKTGKSSKSSATGKTKSKSSKPPSYQSLRGMYYGYATLGGFDQMTAIVGGFWDSMLGEGRRWWITANSDSHVNLSDGGSDFWPGEYSKTYVYAAKDYDDILGGLRAGRVFVTTGDLVSEVDLTVVAGDDDASTGGEITVPQGTEVEIRIRVRDPGAPNAGGDDPKVKRIDVITGDVAASVTDPTVDSNPTTQVVRRFIANDWRAEGEYLTMVYPLKADTSKYVRIRGTNTDEMEPAEDWLGENPWADLWFYSNPVFISVE